MHIYICIYIYVYIYLYIHIISCCYTNDKKDVNNQINTYEVLHVRNGFRED